MKHIISCLIALCALSEINATSRQDSQFSNLYYKHDKTFHDIRKKKSKCLIVIHTNAIFNYSYLNLKNLISLARKQSVGTISKTLYTLGKLKYEKRILKKDKTQPEGFVWDALLEKYDDSTPEQKMLISNLRLLTAHICSMNSEMAQLLTNMHTGGHTFHAVSNIGRPSLDVVISTLKESSKKQISDSAFNYCTGMILAKTSTIPSKKNGWLFPEQENFYTKLSEKNASGRTRIYIDCNRKNVVAAVQAGFDIGIVFKNHGNLVKVLKALNVPMLYTVLELMSSR